MGCVRAANSARGYVAAAEHGGLAESPLRAGRSVDPASPGLGVAEPSFGRKVDEAVEYHLRWGNALR
jgi:hypothetical protein